MPSRRISEGRAIALPKFGTPVDLPSKLMKNRGGRNSQGEANAEPKIYCSVGIA
ncbi:MAG: hypothetical protein RMK18_12380 [Armatimonadota bacterium]|nr:hypothetical protein [Armatimonadota bacterium]MDW8026643.1 hypothetical protein [Armatimonadota bacterium]